MNLPLEASKSVRSSLRLVPAVATPVAAPPAPRFTRSAVAGLDPMTGVHRRLNRRLRSACALYVRRCDLNDLVQEVWVALVQTPEKLSLPDSRLLSWLIGVGRNKARGYTPLARAEPIEVVLAREAGDDLDGRSAYEDVDDALAERAERNG